MRVSGFVFANPIFGRTNLSNFVKAGMTMVLSVFVWSVDKSDVSPPATVVELVVRLLLELCVGLALSFTMYLFFTVVQLGGEAVSYTHLRRISPVRLWCPSACP